MITRSVLVMILLSAKLLMAQDSLTNNILTTKKFRYGIFGNPKEFRENSPSVTGGFRIEVDSGKFKGNKLYQWILRYDNGKKVRRAYGFSDGTLLYVNARTFDPTSDYFIPVLILGPVIYFEDYFGRWVAEGNAVPAVPLGIAGGMITMVGRHMGHAVASENPGWLIYLSDEDGLAYTLDKKSIASILKESDMDLYQEFKKDTRPMNNAVLKEYLIEFNRRKTVELVNETH